VNALEKMLEGNRLPALFLGAGFSKRYLEDMLTWEELLIDVANDINISKLQFYAIKERLINEKGPETNVLYPALATELSRLLVKKIEDNEINAETLVEECDIKHLVDGASYFKLLVTKKVRNKNLKRNPKIVDEIEDLKKAMYKVNNVFTTNYDTLLENEILVGLDYNVFVNQQDLYFSNSFGIGEAYKIHGCISEPKNIVIDTKDYTEYNENMNIFISKMYNTLINRPLIFMGFSMEDPNIKAILQNFIKHFSMDILKEVSNNMFFVEYDCGNENLDFSTTSFQLTSKSIEMQRIKTDNFSLIYKCIADTKQAISIKEIKKYNEIIYDLLAIHEKKGKKVFIADAIDIDKIDSDRLVLGVYPKTSIASDNVFGIIGTTTAKIIEYALYNSKKILFKNIANEWAKKSLTDTLNFPCYYISQNLSPEDPVHEKYKLNFQKREDKYFKIVDKAGLFKEKNPNYKNTWEKHFETFFKKDKSIKNDEYTKLLYLIINGDFNVSEVRPKLQEIFENQNEVMNITQFRQLVCYLAKVEQMEVE
jgi:hypothetical protein